MMKIYLNILVLLFISSANLYSIANESNIQFQNNDNKAKLLVSNWKEDVYRVMEKAIPTSNFGIYLVELESYNQMADYGVSIIPHIFEFGEEAFSKDEFGSRFLGTLTVYALVDFTRKEFEQFKPSQKSFFQLYVNWWKNGYEDDIKKFNALYEEYIKTKESSVIAEMQDIGIRILPEVIDKIEDGDVFLIPVVEHLERLTWKRKEKKKYLTISKRSDLSQEEKISMIMEWWNKNKDRYSMDYKKITNSSNKPAQEN